MKSSAPPLLFLSLLDRIILIAEHICSVVISAHVSSFFLFVLSDVAFTGPF